MIFLNISILIIFIILWTASKSYEKDFISQLDEKQHKLKKIYPLALYLVDKILRNSLFQSAKIQIKKLDEPLKELYVGEKLDLVKRLYLCNKAAIVIFIIFVSNILSLLYNIKEINNYQLLNGKYIQRPGYTDESKQVVLDVNIAEENSTVLEDEIQLEVEKKQYDEQELNELFTYAKKYIDSRFLNNNKSVDSILSNLDFISSIPGTGLTVRWRTENEEVVDKYGKVHNESLSKEELISITAVITYYKREEEYTRYVQVLPKQYTKEELIRQELTKALSDMDEKSRTEERVTLPDTLDHKKISWSEKKTQTGSFILLLGCLTAVILFIAMDRDLNLRVEKRNREMLLDYPEIINKFTLLVGAGMSLSNAWCKISGDYKEKGVRKRYAYEEMMITYGELKIGTSETTAYEQFGRRIKLIPYLRFSSLIAQNVKKGSADLIIQLELEASEAFEERKELAKRLGEEAGTKLLLPMMLMLLIVLSIIMVPAFLSFGI